MAISLSVGKIVISVALAPEVVVMAVTTILGAWVG